QHVLLAARDVHDGRLRVAAHHDLLAAVELGEQRGTRVAVDRDLPLDVGDERDAVGERRRGGREHDGDECALNLCFHWTASASAAAGATRAVRMPQTLTGLCPFTLCVPSGSKLNRSPIFDTTASVMTILRPSSLVSPSTLGATLTASRIAE